ncbi:hypothetical protein ACFFMN_12670 [Planobispora siamensis]|uniref:Putative lipoprotein n=1 Tax=Planobispora siamensis TaxID=936338 RepID=A0A8J3WII7_9ACTN|nr:hypothetical protein [Planobispora siamensis]GIH89792.1 putative lipoprotein [Planobispora siamensis]
MRGQGRRGLLALSLALVTAAAVTTACSAGEAAPTGSPAASDTTTVPAAPARPQVTVAEATRALKDILAADAVLGAADPQRLTDQNQLLKQARDGYLALTQAAFTSAASMKQDTPLRTWGEPQLLVPRLNQGPAWFAAVVDRRDAGGRARPALLTVVRAGQGWQISSMSLLDTAPPEIARDAEGYAAALGADDPGVQISPRLMAPLHATTAEEGRAGFATGLIADGPHTTAHATEIISLREEGKHEGLGYDSIFAAANYPVHALRTADGGALIMYSLIRTTTWTAKIYHSAEDLLAKVPEDQREDHRKTLKKEVRIVETQQYVSTVPPKSSRELARVIGYVGGITRVTSS